MKKAFLSSLFILAAVCYNKLYAQCEITSVTHDSVCAPGGQVNLSVTAGNSSIRWFSSVTGGDTLHTGATYSPVVDSTTTYYVESTTPPDETTPSQTIPMSGHVTTYSSGVRGYFFTAPASFYITSLYVPTEASSAPQSIAVVRFNGATTPPTFNNNTNAFTTLFLTQNNSSSGSIPVNILVNEGDVIGILGSRDGITSYGTTNYVSSINSTPVILYRMVMQYDLRETAPKELSYEYGNTGRVIFEYKAFCQSSSRVPVTAKVNPTYIGNSNHTINYSQLPYAFGTQTLTQAGIYTETFQAASGCDSTVTLQLDVVYTIAGKVHNDVNGMNSGNTINGNGTNAGGLKAVLVDENADTLTAYTAVDVNGNFVFDDVPLNNYSVLITNSSITGNNVPAITLPSGWVHTGEKPGAGTGSDGTTDGRLELGLLSQNLSIRFGIQLPPVASNSNLASQLNPGSNASVNLPNSSFNMSDPSPGSVTKVRFTAFPAGTDNFYINGNTYNSSNWPGIAEVNAQYLFGNLIMPNVGIDPATGPQQVVISYQAIDAAGAASNTTTITMPFIGITIGGTVHNNFQGMNGSPVNTIAGPGTNGGGLYAVLSEDISNKVVATQAVNGSTGAFQFTGIDIGYYSVRLCTTDALTGSIAPASGINPGWEATADKNGTGAGNDGFADSKTYLGLQSANNSNIRFGIQQPPTASLATAALQLNPNGNINYTVPATTFVTTDAAPGAVTSLYFSGALPTNANKLVLNGVTYSATNPLPPAGVHVAVSGGSPANPILVDPVNGNVTVSISYNAVDAAGMMSAVTIAAQPFHKTAAVMTSNTNNNGNGATPANPEGQGIATFKAMDISIYPNPTKDRVFISANDLSPIKSLRLLDIQGRELRMTQQDIANGMDLNGVPSGTYLLQVELQSGSSQRFKVVKE